MGFNAWPIHDVGEGNVGWIQGRIVGAPPLVAPLSRRPCFFYSVLAPERADQTARPDELMLEDETGVAVVVLAGAMVQLDYDFEKKVNADRRVIVGVNAFTEGNEDDDLDLLRITNEHEQAQIKRLQAVKADRDTNLVDSALERVRETARDPEANLMPVLIDAVQQYATEGEIMDALADVFGRYVETPRL